MYDRLGDLLSETLEAGEVKFIKVEAKKVEEETQRLNVEGKGKSQAEKKEEERPKKNSSKAKPKAHNVFIYKTITPELERAYRLLDISFQSSLEEIKKSYKEKLKYYHPDRYEDNEVLKKVATDKTRQIVAAYKMINDFLEK